MTSLALVHHSFGPYHLARARQLLALHPATALIQLADAERLREWKTSTGLSLRTVSHGALEDQSASALSRRLIEILSELNPDVLIVAGYALPAFRDAARWARTQKKAAVLLSDSQAQDRPRLGVREVAKRLWVQRHFQTAFTSGSLGTSYVASLGIPAERTWRGYDVVDNAAFAERSTLARQRGDAVRAEHKLPARYFLYAGRLSPEKNLSVLVDAYTRYRSSTSSPRGLVFAGNGPELKRLQAQCQPFSEDVRFTGFVQEPALADVYALADALVLPSLSEPWGLVVNEAMACGLPVVASTACGAAADLVFPGVNGYLFNPRDTQSLAEALIALASDDEGRAEMGKASARIIQPWSVEAWARALVSCARAAHHLRRTTATPAGARRG